MAELEESEKYVPPYKLKERIRRELEANMKKTLHEKTIEMAMVMITNGESIAKIIEYTGLSKAAIQRLKAEPDTKKSKK